MRRTAEFKRGVKALATREGWLVEIDDRKGPTEAIIIFKRESGDVQRIATLVIRQDAKEISPGVAQSMIRKQRQRISNELADPNQESLRQSVETLITWMQSWF